MALPPSGREEMIAANISRARSNSKKASNAINTGKSTATQKTQQKKESDLVILRYPKAAIDKTTDMLSIKIFEYENGTDIFGLTKGKDSSEFIGALTGFQTRGDKLQTIKPGSAAEKKLQKNSVFIYLPIPQQVSDSLVVDYAADSLNPLQIAGLNVASETIAKGPFEVAQEVKSLLGNFQGLSSSASDALVKVLAGKAVNQLGGNVNVQSLITRASGQILQSNLELLFSGVTLRSFPFIFDFAPRDPDEAEEVMNIIRTFKQSMVPRGGKVGARSTIFINSPKLFQFEYISGNDEHPFLNKFKTGVITDMNVNYTASGTYATYSDGTPVHIRMQCTLKEINPVYAEDYDEPIARRGVGY